MTTAATIPLRKLLPAVFPDRCVSCGVEKPGGTHRFVSQTLGWWTWTIMCFGKLHSVDAPVCPSCRRRIRLQYWARMVVCVLAMAVCALLATQVAGHYQGPGRKFLLMGIAMAFLLPLYLLHVLHAPPFEITVYKKKIEYQFRDREYAMEFMKINQLNLYY